MSKLLSLLGFDNIFDLTGIYNPILHKHVLLISVSVGSVMSAAPNFINKYTGISVVLFLFIVLGSIFDIALGWYVNVYVLKHDFQTSKFIRGIVKTFIILSVIVMGNSFMTGIEDTHIQIVTIKSTIMLLATTVHYSIVTLTAMYLLLGISENGAALGIKPLMALTRILKMKINKTIGKASKGVDIGNHIVRSDDEYEDDNEFLDR